MTGRLGELDHPRSAQSKYVRKGDCKSVAESLGKRRLAAELRNFYETNVGCYGSLR